MHRREGKHLPKMMPLKKSHKDEVEDNDAYDNWWARRISVARNIYEKMGFKSMVQRVLEHIFLFSLKTIAHAPPCSSDGVIGLAMT